MRRWLIAVLLLVPQFSWASVLRGTARNSKGQIVYHEKHTITHDQDGLSALIRVEYSKPDGSIFASMTSDFSSNKFVPTTIFEDMRFNKRVVLKSANSNFIFEKFRDGKLVSEKSHPQKGNSMVASQGFDNFIRTNMDRLTKNSVEFGFGVLEKAKFFNFIGEALGPKNADTIEFGIQPSNPLFRIFVSDLRVIYDAKSKRLIRFQGPSNIVDDKGKSQDVEITYVWEDEG